MRINLIVACDANDVIGNGGALPWKIQAEMKHFRDTTMGFPVIMGRKTYESLPPKYRPLPGRTTIVLSKSAEGYDGAYIARSLDEAVHIASFEDPAEVFIAGGHEVYRAALQSGVVDRMLVSRIKGSFLGDTSFPFELMGEYRWTADTMKDCEQFFVTEYTRVR